MSTLPQLRVRTGYTFRDVYGRMGEVFGRLSELGVTTAGIVDASTWGHVRFEQAAKKAGIQPMFGMEIPIICEEGSEWEKFKPKSWVLAEDTRKFYNLTSASTQGKGLRPADLAAASGVIRFLGGSVLAAPNPDAYDYADLNPSSLLGAWQAAEWARANGKPMVLTGYNDMPHESHKTFAYAWEVRDSVGLRTINDVDVIRKALGGILSASEFEKAIQNTFDIAERLSSSSLQRAPLIHFDGDLEALVRDGQRSRLARGHIEAWTPEYEERLQIELSQIKQKDFESYFLVVSDLVRYAKKHMLVGPARGSSAGSLVCYLTDITEVDPIPNKLLFQRFIDISRADLPDIDIDFADTKRHLVFEYLQEKYGVANVAKLGNINTLKAASVMAQVGKKFGIGIHETSQVRNALIEYSSGDARYGKGLQDTIDTTDPGKEFKRRRPVAAACMGDLEIHPSHTGVHAAGILVCNEKISDFCTVNAEGVAQIDKPDSEYLNLLKIDALGLRTLGIIEDAGVVTSDELFSLKFDDQSVLDILNEDKVSGVFQFEGAAVRSVTRMMVINAPLTSFSQIDNLTALARPGPLSSGMAYKYIDRVSGKEAVTYEVPQLEKYLSETYGVLLYQEQVMSVVKEIGLFDWVKTSAVRKAMSGSKGEEYFNLMGADFVAGATSQGLSEVAAKKIWQEMVTFGSWGFNKSHSLSYAIVTYWTLWMKRYHPLEFAAACLRSAKDDDQVIAILRELAKEGVTYTAIDPDYSDMNWKAADGRLIGGIQNAKGYGPAKALAYVQKRADGTLTQKDKDRLANAAINYADLNEAHTKWGHFYARPRLCGVTSGDPIIGMKECQDRQTCIVIAKLAKKVLADENEAIRVKKRGGVIKKGNTQFIDLMMVDDSSDTPMRFRIRPDKYDELGKDMAETAKKDDWFLVKGWKIKDIDMFIVKNIKKLEES
ncbi:DNA polymerase III alpha subunit [Xanthomonas phage Carpasina]|uniref:DNA polymerase III alpha subunit n=1 Tax=Xanthomonas phage Carpasina TaxID=2163636 RepID=A0A2S1GSW0_9CAUD|nr:DNA polymerase [Xanthomonas phage Carpasina]AWD92439.1 DNA polymerase III alpha subunit [Xanthomonas phage Carpasina]